MSEERVSELDADGRVREAIDLIIRYGGIDGAHHKQWCLDQTLRILCGEDHERVIEESKDGTDGPESYEWDEGVPP